MVSANDAKRLAANVRAACEAVDHARMDARAIWWDAPDYEDLCEIANSLDYAYAIVCGVSADLDGLTA